MKAVLISIQPKWCGLIASGEKTVEVRKTKPKIDVPFKCYIYCTLQGSNEFFQNLKNSLGEYEALSKWNRENWGIKKSKVIGEFVCNEISYIEKRGFNNNFDYCYLSLNEWGNDDIEIEITSIKKSCVSKEELNLYGKNSSGLYAWHISDLKIYDKPKELGEFKKMHRECWYADLGPAKRDCPECKNKECFMQRPPQSWCYVEERS